jgi:hypothetical protein
MKRLVIVFAAVLLFAVSFSTIQVQAQSQNATLGGSVVDASAALIPGVEVTAANDGTGIVTTVVTNETGTYQFPSLQPGAYTVSATLPGFQTQTYKGVALGLSQQVRLNFTLHVGTQAQSVEVTIAADTLIATTSASVGNVLPDYKVSDLPIANRNVLDLVRTAPGVGGGNGDTFAGLSNTFTMTTRDGIPINNGRSTPGSNLVFTTTFSSPDLVEQVRIITAPADAEIGRGSGQVQLQTRSGSNQFRGAVFWTNRNAVWDASTSRNNFQGVPKNYINRNQFGVRAGGPIIKNKTFFFFLYEGQRRLEKQSVVANVLTDPARSGIFRYFTGRQNGNFSAPATTRSVERDGSLNTSLNPADLRQINVFSYDPLRPGPDPSGMMGRIISAMPRPNDFTVGDGLNTAGYRWSRGLHTGGGSDASRNGLNLRLDHNFNSRHKLSMVGSREKDWADANTSTWPNGFNGLMIARPAIYTASFVSTLSPTLLNEFRFGLRRGRLDNLQAYDNPETGAEARKWLGFAPGPGGPVSPGGTPFIVEGTLFAGAQRTAGVGTATPYLIADTNGSVGNTSPLWTYADNLSWTRGTHSFKGGVELRLGNGDAWNSDEIIPRVHLGPTISGGGRQYFCSACGIPVAASISSANIIGLHANDVQRVRDLLTDLSGSVANISQAFSLKPDPKSIAWLDYPVYYKKFRDYHQNEFMTFFKDDWKVTNNLTLNLGARWEWYGVPWESHGMMARPTGGNLFGLSGSSFADWYKPGIRGTLTTTEFVGKNSPNPDVPIYNNDWNNFGPAVGFSYSLPWFKRSTVLRGGYGVNYQGRFAGGGLLGIDINVGTGPGLNQYASHPTTNLNLADLFLNSVKLPVGERYKDGFLPVAAVTERSQAATVYDVNQRTPYAQNFNLELQRELFKDLTMEVRYVGTKGTKLNNTININVPIIVENGLMDAIRITREGGNAPLFDEMLRGLVFAGIGTVGVNVSGSSALRQFSGTRNDIANGNLAGVANYLNTNSSFTGQTGGMLRRNGFPENFIVANPQYSSASILGAGNNSTYHSMQMAVTKRLSNGFTNQTTYTWSRSIGTAGNIDPRNRTLNKSLLGDHRTHDIRSNGTLELPFGPNRALLNNSPAWVSRIVEGWQFGGIFSWTSGQPLTITAGDNPFGGASQFPDIMGSFPKNIGKLTASATAGNREYFTGFQRVADPGLSSVTTADSLNLAYGRFAIVDPSGKIVLQHAALGKVGNMGQNWIEGPGVYSFDVNMLKRIRIQETKTFILRIDAVNVLNHPTWGNPTTNINSTSFGLVALPTTGNRQFTFNMRVEF